MDEHELKRLLGDYAASTSQGNRTIEAIREAFEALEAPKREAIAEFHAVERWRDRLLEEGDVALAELLTDYPDADRQQLRQLVPQTR